MSNLKREAKKRTSDTLLVIAAMGELYGLHPKRAVTVFNQIAVLVNSHDNMNIQHIVEEGRLVATTVEPAEVPFVHAATGYLIGFLFKVQ